MVRDVLGDFVYHFGVRHLVVRRAVPLDGERVDGSRLRRHVQPIVGAELQRRRVLDVRPLQSRRRETREWTIRVLVGEDLVAGDRVGSAVRLAQYLTSEAPTR